MTRALRTDHGQGPDENARKVDLGKTGTVIGTLIKGISQAVSRLPVGGRRLGEVVLLKGRQLRQERIGGNRVKARRKGLG